ncbi:MAG: hypothetical protein KAJ03_04095 [Gammaproteobacteria bacterium]|nr:hypothetical protein [Gammaproteobacteria bacterium]
MFINKKAKNFLNFMKTTDLPQGRGYLCKDGEFCFWGAFCEYQDLPYETDNTDTRYYREGDDRSFDVWDQPPWYDLRELRFTYVGMEKILSLNDDDKLTFKQIVERIEEHPERYFD